MKKTTKLLSLLLAMLMLFGTLPMIASASAALNVEEVGISVQEPIVGETTNFNVSRYTLSSKYNLAAPEILASWFESDKKITTKAEFEDLYYNAKVQSAGPESGEFYKPFEFKQDKYYVFYCLVEAIEGYVFAPSTEYYINGERAFAIDEKEGEYSETKEIWFCFEPVAAINSIAVFGIDRPVPGEKADTTTMYEANQGYSCASGDNVYWFEFSEEPNNPNPDEVSFHDYLFENADEVYSDGLELYFKADKYYVVMVPVTAEILYHIIPCAFASDATGTLNGKEAIVTSYDEYGYYEKEICYIFAPHNEHSYENGVCTDCGDACTHTYENGKCKDCEIVCRHRNANGDNKCDTCDFICTCGCHKTGIARFFWSIGNFFRKLFGNKVPCVCGRAH